MQPLTDKLPKPLLKVGDKTLIEHQIIKLVAAGIDTIVINHFYLGSKIEDLLGSGQKYAASISYSPEAIRLETAGGIIKALPALQDDCFVVVNADIWTDFDFATLPEIDGDECLAHLVMVPNAAHKPQGDFAIDVEGLLHETAGTDGELLTFSGISVLHRKLFKDLTIQPSPLVPLLRNAMKLGKARGEVHNGLWMDIGTPERLQELNDIVARKTTS